MSLIGFDAPPPEVSRVIVHQFDPARPSPGGIDTCLRGICRYLPADESVAVVGVDTGSGPEGRRLGRWERHRIGAQAFWFLPVAALDPADQARRIPHVVRLLGGIARFRGRIPRRTIVQVHRMDSAFLLRALLPGDQVYMIHTQENGLVGNTSDSFWRFLGGIHGALERNVVRKAKNVIVFNRDYAEIVRRWNADTAFSPTWYDPHLIVKAGPHSRTRSLLWVGRLETPKDPILAVRVLEELVRAEPGEDWSLDLLGSGTLEAEVRAAVQGLDDDVRARVRLHGRVAPQEVAALMSDADLFLMTSFPGYEGFPRVLVEAMASGLPAVVTEGSDTGGLVVDGATGYTEDRDPRRLAARAIQARAVPRADVVAAVAALEAPALIARIFALSQPAEYTRPLTQNHEQSKERIA